MTSSQIFLIGFALFRVYMKQWKTPENGKKFDPYFRQAEKKYGLPRGLLSRMAYQESRFRPDIISGQTKSKAGAVGLMQIIPAYHPNVNPLDPVASIDYAASFMAALHRQFKSWRLALGAYNWGAGNMKKYLSKTKIMPVETRNYISNIAGDVGFIL